jgi:hypothetical protein
VTREKALEAMDKLVAMGYSVNLSEYDLGPHGHVQVGEDGQMTSLQRWLSISAVSFDKVDLRALVAVADELDLDVGISPIDGVNKISFSDQLPEHAASRRHPR